MALQDRVVLCVGSGAAQTILEPALNFILSGIGIGDSPLKMFIISFLSKKEGFWNVFILP